MDEGERGEGADRREEVGGRRRKKGEGRREREERGWKAYFKERRV
jgi:hypothetical protein